MINYYFDDTDEQKPFTHKLEASDNTAPPDNALRVAPVFKDGHWPCVQNGAWVLVEDNRGKTAYNIETKTPIEIDYLGIIKDGFTVLKPFDFCQWDGTKWILDNDAKNDSIIKNNQSLKNTLINEANEKISILLDAIDLDMAEDGDEEKLKNWKKYRILLTRIDTSDINVIFPTKP
jgi:hypothetical protein